MARGTKKLTEDERKAAIREWANTPSQNPRYKGATPDDIARALMLSRDPKVRAVQLAKWAEERRSVTAGKVVE